MLGQGPRLHAFLFIGGLYLKTKQRRAYGWDVTGLPSDDQGPLLGPGCRGLEGQGFLAQW